MNSLQTELEQILNDYSAEVADQFGGDTDKNPVVQSELEEALQAILTTVSKHLPEKRTAMMVTHCPYCSRNFPTVEEEYNTAISEMEKKLGGSV